MMSSCKHNSRPGEQNGCHLCFLCVLALGAGNFKGGPGGHRPPCFKQDCVTYE